MCIYIYIYVYIYIWGVQWMADTGGATNRTLTETTAKRKELQLQLLEVQIEIASDYTWFPLHAPLRNVAPAPSPPGSSSRRRAARLHVPRTGFTIASTTISEEKRYEKKLNNYVKKRKTKYGVLETCSQLFASGEVPKCRLLRRRARSPGRRR